MKSANYRKPGIWSLLGTVLENLGWKLRCYQSQCDYRRYERQNRRTAHELERKGCL
ncbi:hypothetical protein [Methylomonas koyamae]|uniref:hypothetical protein n=1 Tax=Methylomonas koyamae TaxID=702114 RepID=UPI000A948F2F|nr:hypothetical protein [Methylomonas koyamae]